MTAQTQARLRQTTLWLLLLPCFFAGSMQAASLREVLAEFETGTIVPTASAGDHKIGLNKEVSRYQILPSVWKDYTRSAEYWNPTTAWSVAERVLADRRKAFRQATGRECDHVDLYLIWNAPGAYAQARYNRKKVSRVVRERAERFANLATARLAPQLANK
jgi:hypothetical protein